MLQTMDINVTRLIDQGRVGRVQILTFILCALAAFLDGVDSQAIALAAPVIGETMQISRSALGPVFSAAFLGAAVGAFSFGALGDRFGRKRTLIAATLIFGAFTVLTTYAETYNSLLVMRLCAGIGLGGATPCFIALGSEYAPARRRGMVASLIWAAFPLGGAIGGFVNGAVLGMYGWQTMFLISGLITIGVAVLLALYLPESVRYLIATAQPVERIRAVVARLRPELPVASEYTADEERSTGASVRRLFTDGRAGMTLLLWVPFFTAFSILSIVVNWSPILLREHGLPPSAAGIALGNHGLGALIGMACAGHLVERFGARRVLCPSMLIGAVLTALLGFAAASLTWASIDLALIGVTVGIGGSGSLALAAILYPTAIRSTGVGWAMGVGRFGQVLMPLFAAAVTAAGNSGETLFLLFGILPLMGAAAAATRKLQHS